MLIRQKFENAGYPSSFTDSVIRGCEHKLHKRQDLEGEFFIPPNLLKIAKELILV